MLDNIISKGNYAYQFRVDILPVHDKVMIDGISVDISGDVNLLKKYYSVELCKFLTQEEFQDWICSFEVSPAGKHHYQCIIWHSKILSTKDRNQLKAKYFRKNRDSKNSISFTDAKKIANLSSYVLKDQEEFESKTDINEDNLITTLTFEQIESIPKWLTKNALKNKWKKELEDEILIIISEDVYGRRPSKFKFATEVIEFHIKNDHPPPSRMALYKLLLKYLPSYTTSDYLQDIGFLEQ